MEIVLFDLDGVLIEPRGYRIALQDVIRKLGRLCGVPGCSISQEVIADFEAAGVSSEWDSLAMCYVSLLQHIWRQYPSFSIPNRLDNDHPILAVRPLNFTDLPKKISSSSMTGLSVLQRIDQGVLLENDLSPEHYDGLKKIIYDARKSLSLTYLLFQEMVAGSHAFNKIYQLDPVFETESYLKLFDIPKLDNSMSTRILDWVRKPGHNAALFTSRPGIAPPPSRLTPDAEIGSEMLGLVGIPVASQGKLAWLAQQLGMEEQSLIKPAPAHSLLAILLAMGAALTDTPPVIKSFLNGNNPSAEIRKLDGVMVTVFEDSIGGILSLQRTCQRLAEMKIEIQTRYIGISDYPLKVRSLRRVGAKVFDKTDDALISELI